ncbi:MAG: NUDIX domain-containing protein [Hyphomicrobiales bacterium]|nr:NUDIX domain-containing protein [Hyphomicrobiales bacterium]MBV9742113.1 NUDIX domain-containing protein [Hyphomicrobiales bacterium]
MRLVAVGIARRDGRLLVVEVLDDDGNRKGWRPPGGGVKFLELTGNALRREMREELACKLGSMAVRTFSRTCIRITGQAATNHFCV